MGNRTEFIGLNLYYSQEFVDDLQNDYIEEIERLKEEKESWKRVATKNFNEAEDYKSIIKEVREYLDTLEKQHAYKFVEVDNHTEMRIDENEYLVWCKYNKLLKILDKGE